MNNGVEQSLKAKSVDREQVDLVQKVDQTDCEDLSLRKLMKSEQIDWVWALSLGSLGNLIVIALCEILYKCVWNKTWSELKKTSAAQLTNLARHSGAKSVCFIGKIKPSVRERHCGHRQEAQEFANFCQERRDTQGQHKFCGPKVSRLGLITCRETSRKPRRTSAKFGRTRKT